MITVNYSNNFKAIESRIRRLPKMMDNYMSVQTKKDAIGVVKEYQDGLAGNRLNLEKLNDFTLGQKVKNNYDNPSSPLLTKKSLERTLYKGLEIVKKGDGWILRFSRKKHHEADLTINQLHQIHENGCIIMVTPKMRGFLHWIGLHLKEETVMIRIPPRQAFAKAIAKYMKKRQLAETAKKVKQAIVNFIKTNSEKQLKVLTKYNKRESQILQEIGAVE